MSSILPSFIPLTPDLPYSLWLSVCEPLFDQLRERETPTGVVGMPHSYFSIMAGRDYAAPEKAVFREFFQNSIDAGAKRIDIHLVGSDESEDSPISNQVILEDNGCGMDEYILRNRLLVLGGSQKKYGSVGMFGKAKELLYFAWERYLIHTQDQLVIGQGATYEIFQLPRHLAHKGTTSIINFWKTNDDSKREFQDQLPPYFVRSSAWCTFAASFVIANSAIRNVRFTFDDKKLVCARQERLVNPITCYEIHRRELRPGESPQIHVRSGNGLWMFSTYVPDEYPEIGYQALYPQGTSIEVFTSNRDAVKGIYRDYFDDYKQKIFNSPEKSKKIDALHLDAKTCIEQFRHPIKKDSNEKFRWDMLEKMPVFIDGKEKTACRKFFANKRAVQVFCALLKPIFDVALCALHEIHPELSNPQPHLGVIFSNQVVGRQEEKNSQTTIYINPNQFNFSDLSKANLSTMATCIHFILAHEFSHIFCEGHNTRFTAEEYAFFRKMAELQPNLENIAVEAAWEAIQPSNQSHLILR